MAKILNSLILSAVLAFTLCCAGAGCQNTPAAAVGYHTLKDTQIAVDHAMQLYATRCAQGQVSAPDQARADAAHAQYRAAFRQAVAVARLDYSKLTPDNVAALAQALLNILSPL